MNQVIPPDQGQQSAPKPSMGDALADIFATDHRRGFAEKLSAFAQVLTNAHWACCYAMGDGEEPVVLAGSVPDTVRDKLPNDLAALLSDPAAQEAETIAKTALILSRIALPDGSLGVLALGVTQSSKVQSALGYERAVFLSTLTFARNKPADRSRQDTLVAEVQSVATGERDLTRLVNLLALQTGAQYAAAAFWRDGTVEDLKISGQDKPTKRAALPETLRRDMRSTATQRLLNSERGFAAAADQDDGLILHLEGPTRNLGTVQNLAALFALVQTRRERRWFNPASLTKAGAAALVLTGIVMIPLPDGVELPALVEAETQRVVTAPVTATLEQVLVSDGDTIPDAGTPLVTLDTAEIQAELIGIRAEQAKALLEREAARAARNPAALRSAELEVERLKTRIDLLEYRLRIARITAPIAGLVVAPDLKERQGTTVRQGEDLMTISDPSVLRLKLSIPETQIGRLEDGATGIFRPDYDPTLRIDSTISLISPAKIGDGPEQMFLGRARLEGDATGLRPGLNGVLSVQRKARPLGLIVYEAIRNYVLLRVWL